MTGNQQEINYFHLPDSNGKFGKYGGKYVPEVLIPAILELEEAYKTFKDDPDFKKEIQTYSKNYIGRPTPKSLTSSFKKGQKMPMAFEPPPTQA